MMNLEFCYREDNTPNQIVKAIWLGVKKEVRKKGKWHKWLKEKFNF